MKQGSGCIKRIKADGGYRNENSTREQYNIKNRRKRTGNKEKKMRKGRKNHLYIFLYIFFPITFFFKYLKASKRCPDKIIHKGGTIKAQSQGSNNKGTLGGKTVVGYIKIIREGGERC